MYIHKGGDLYIHIWIEPRKHPHKFIVDFRCFKTRKLKLRLDQETVQREREMSRYLESTSGEFNTDGGFGFQAELVASESREEIRLTDAGVSDENHFEQVVVFFFRSSRHCS